MLLNLIFVSLGYLKASYEYSKVFPNYEIGYDEILYREYRLFKTGLGFEQKKEADIEQEAY